MVAILLNTVISNAIVDSRLRPVLLLLLMAQFKYNAAVSNPCCPLLSHFEYTLFYAIMCKYDVVHKPEIHSVSQRHQRRTESHGHL